MSSKEEYDGLSAEEREQVDTAALKKEAEEQAGLDTIMIAIARLSFPVNSLS